MIDSVLDSQDREDETDTPDDEPMAWVLVTVLVPGVPVSKGRPRAVRAAGGIRMHTPGKTAEWERRAGNLAALRMQAEGLAVLTGPVRVEVVATLPIPASWSKRRQADAMTGRIRPTARPDADNYLKAALDALNGIVWQDDAQVVDARVRKRYGTVPGVRITVEGLALEAVRRRAERQTVENGDKGTCANRGAITGPHIAFCDSDCRDDYEARAAALRVWSRGRG